MKAVSINSELKNVTEKHMDMDWLTIFGLIMAVGIALIINFCLPLDEAVKGIISMAAAAPIVLVSIKDFYGLRSYRLAAAVILCLVNNRYLEYRSEGIWKELNKYVRGRRKELTKDEKSAEKHTAVNAGMHSS